MKLESGIFIPRRDAPSGRFDNSFGPSLWIFVFPSMRADSSLALLSSLDFSPGLTRGWREVDIPHRISGLIPPNPKILPV